LIISLLVSADEKLKIFASESKKLLGLLETLNSFFIVLVLRYLNIVKIYKPMYISPFP